MMYKQEEQQPFLQSIQKSSSSAPSAPPESPNNTPSRKTVTPFQISVIDAYPVAACEGTMPFVDTINMSAKAQQRLSDNQLAQGRHDGLDIASTESKAAAISNNVGKQKSAVLTRDIQSSNNDRLHDFTIKNVREPPVVAVPMFNNPVVRDPDEEYVRPAVVQKQHEGYQISEYKSMYEDSAGGMNYCPSEYKSMYD